MEVPVLEPYVGVHDSAEENLESKESCSSLARSDSGQGKSLSSVDYHEENILPDESKHLEATPEIDDQLNGTFKETTPCCKGQEASNENAFSNHSRTVSSVCTNLDSGIEKSPVSQHFTFLNGSSDQLQECNSKGDMSFRKQQKDMFEGPVSDLTGVSQGRSGKSSLQRQKSFDSSHCPLSLSSFDNDKLLSEPVSNNINPSPAVSILSSADCNGKCCHHVNIAHTQNAANPAHRLSYSPCNYVLRKMQAQTDVNGFNEHGNTADAYTVGIQSGCGQLLTSTVPEAAIFNCHMPPQGMFPKSTLDSMAKELTMAKRTISEAKRKISELEYDNFKIRENNAALSRENRTMYENRMMYENWQLQLQRPCAAPPNVDFWKNKYVETKEQLQIKERELQSKQDELNLRNADLEAMEEELQRIRFLSEGRKSQASSDEDQNLRHLLQGSVRLRPDLSSSDETQVKATYPGH